MAFVPVSKTLGIDIEWNKPKNLRNAAARKTWLKKALVEAKQIKLDLESGRLKAHEMPGRIIENPDRKLISEVEAHRFEKELLKREKSLLTERDFIDLFGELEHCLTSWDLQKCRAIFCKMKRLKITKMMLLRNPDCVHKMRVLRDFGGDVKEFNEDDMSIRQNATELYANFKKIFGKNPDTEDSFWSDFCEQAETFKVLTKDMRKIFRTTLCDQGYKRLQDTKASTSAASKVS
ncbi:uncharacterized protein LOC6545501 [Drosophila erecta]|uniref:Lens epithelium-derived growth factor integrase-binding domain-containing protein n=1 Tax=Drosophila erecta TaxID=7220 RepID=B3NIE2_DROER|nr:uncharacterized protein LOC6545501 [Drosophila erecta]EDV52367.2 uncharacterized protein Dere_GG16038 [Drosophila erecta]